MPTLMYRAGVSFSKEMEERLFNLRKRDEFKRCSISEIIRILVEKSLDDYDNNADTTETA